MLEIRPVKDLRDLRRFISFPFKLYSGNPYWVPPLISDELHTLSPKYNSAFARCEAAYWLAIQDGKVVGRIAGIINHDYIQIWGNKWARFGWIDFVPNYKVSAALLKTVEEWAHSKGMDAIHGPMGFCGLDREGMLVEGFDELGTLATIYNYDYYPLHLEHHGYLKDTEMIEYQLTIPDEVPERIERISSLVMSRGGYSFVEATDSKDLLPYAKGALDLLNEAYAHLYGTVPLSDKQKQALIKQFFSYLSPDLAKIILDKEGNIVAFGIAIPSLSKALQKAKGRLFPFGFFHLLKALRKNSLLDLYLIAVKPQLQGKGINAVLISEIAKSAIKRGMTHAESNPEWEENEKVQSQWKHFEYRQHKKRRIYVKHLK